ncbi:MAG: MBL fold metallo-hydrolase [Opitutaceae bacterium]|jgi:glyoxylase-like metal-dependent hydrolase (beta-lactamase superfamily II)|nr:MBL fold metallo-hydrolase [Opitutaceae bacterium]
MEIAQGIHLLKCPLESLWTGVFVLAREKLVVIDTAFDHSMTEVVFPYIKKLGRDPAGIDLVINTHIHGDHIGGNARLKRDTRAKFAAHRLGRERLANPYFHLNKIRSRFSPLVPFQEITSGLTPQEIDLDLDHGREIDLGDSTLRVLHAPGHAAEGICLHDSTSGILFTGDALQGRGTMSTGVALYFNLDDYLLAIDRVEEALAQGGVSMIAASHPFDPISGLVPAGECTEYIKLCRDTAAQYDQILRDYMAKYGGAPDLREAVRQLLEQAGITAAPGVPVLAYHTAAAHLGKIAPSIQWGAPL